MNKCRLSIFLGKCLCIQEKLRTRNSAKYKPPGNIIEAIANAEVERGSQCGQSNGDNIGSYPVLPMNNTRIAANCCDITISSENSESGSLEYSEAAKRNTSGQCSRFCSLLPIRSASSGVLFVGCRYYLQKSERFTSTTALITIKSAPSGRIAHSVFRRSFFTKSSQSSQSSHILE